MSPRITKTQRWLDLISYLLGRRYPVGVGELMERLPGYASQTPDTARRYLERDKEELTRMGIPIGYDDGQRSKSGELQGYTLRTHDFFLPYLKILDAPGPARVQQGVLKPGSISLSPGQFATVAEALHRAATLPDSPFAADARTAYAKLVLGAEPGESDTLPVFYAEPPGAPDRRAVLNRLSDALIDRRAVRFRYRRGGSDQSAVRVADPWGLIRAGGNWHLVGRCHDRDELRQFRVDRMEAVEPAAEPRGLPHFTVPADFDVGQYAYRQAWELGGGTPFAARVRFPAPWGVWAERNGYGEVTERGADGSLVCSFRVRARDPFLRWLLWTDAEAELLDPPELVAELGALVEEIAALHAGVPDE